ncbi:MAG: redoxin domain-containing protein [Xanthomonadaceae bacterium]|nr:redoxin domain-containing protein [Xanthomonadaceae bacterium]
MTLDSTLLGTLVIALTALVAFNLFLSLRLTRLVNALAQARLPDTVPIGAPLPRFQGTLLDGRSIGAGAFPDGQAAVLVFLSAGCQACQQRLPELARMLPLMEESGVALWVVAQGRQRDLHAYFETTGLLHRLVRVDRRSLRRLNPKFSAPFYVFVDADGIVQASNLIGDENWLSFREQIGDKTLIIE